jgi:hypothetical protein
LKIVELRNTSKIQPQKDKQINKVVRTNTVAIFTHI